MEKRTINIGIGTINESLQDKDGLKALTLAIILKAMFGSSIVPNFSIRKIMSITNSRYSSISTAITKGLELGLFEIINNGKVCLKVNKLWDKNKYFVRVNVIKKDRKSVRIYFENGKHSNFKKNINAKSRQTFSDVTNKIIQAKVMIIINNYLKTFDSIVKEHYDSKGIKINLSKLSIDGVRKLYNEIKAELMPGEISYINTGISYDKIHKIIHNCKNGISLYQIIKVIKACIKEKLVVSYSNYIVMSNEYNTTNYNSIEMQNIIKNAKAPRYDGTNARQIFEFMAGVDRCIRNTQKEMIIERDDEGNKIPNRRFIGKNSKCHTVYKRMANGFIMTSNIICRKHNRKHKQHKNYAA